MMSYRSKVTLSFHSAQFPELHSHLSKLTPRGQKAFLQYIVSTEVVDLDDIDKITVEVQTHDMSGNPTERAARVMLGIALHFLRTQGKIETAEKSNLETTLTQQALRSLDTSKPPEINPSEVVKAAKSKAPSIPFNP